MPGSSGKTPRTIAYTVCVPSGALHVCQLQEATSQPKLATYQPPGLRRHLRDASEMCWGHSRGARKPEKGEAQAPPPRPSGDSPPLRAH